MESVLLWDDHDHVDDVVDGASPFNQSSTSSSIFTASASASTPQSLLGTSFFSPASSFAFFRQAHGENHPEKNSLDDGDSPDSSGGSSPRLPRLPRTSRVRVESQSASYVGGDSGPGKPILRQRQSWPNVDDDLVWSLICSQQIMRWTRTQQRTPVLMDCVRRGIPHHLRAKVWPVLTGSKFLMEKNRGYYQSLLSEHGRNPSPSLVQIETDLHRTFPEMVEFNHSFPRKDAINKLRSVLVAYSIQNPRVGYCQVRTSI